MGTREAGPEGLDSKFRSESSTSVRKHRPLTLGLLSQSPSVTFPSRFSRVTGPAYRRQDTVLSARKHLGKHRPLSCQYIRACGSGLRTSHCLFNPISICEATQEQLEQRPTIFESSYIPSSMCLVRGCPGQRRVPMMTARPSLHHDSNFSSVMVNLHSTNRKSGSPASSWPSVPDVTSPLVLDRHEEYIRDQG